MSADRFRRDEVTETPRQRQDPCGIEYHVSVNDFRRDPSNVLDEVLIENRAVELFRHAPGAMHRNGYLTHLAVIVPYHEYERLKKLEQLQLALKEVQAAL